MAAGTQVNHGIRGEQFLSPNLSSDSKETMDRIVTEWIVDEEQCFNAASLPGAACSSNEYRPTRVVGGKRDQLPSVERYGAAVPRCPGHLSLT